MPPVRPTATDLLARTNVYDMFASVGATSYSEVSKSTATLGDDCTVDLRKCTFVGNGGTPETGGGTDVNKYLLTLGPSDFSNQTKPKQLAVVGSLPSTPTAEVGKLAGMRTTASNRYPMAATLRWSWLKGLASDGWPPGGTNAGWDFDGDGIHTSWLSESGLGWLVIDGVWFDNVMDAIALGTGPRGFEIRHCYFTDIRDDVIEADWSNGAGLIYDCLMDGVFMGYSTQGSANRAAELTTFEDCIIRIDRFPWFATRPATCTTYGAYEQVSGQYLGCGMVDKRNGNLSPKLHFKNCLIYQEAYQVGAGSCTASATAMGFKDSTHCTAEDSTFIWGGCPNASGAPIAFPDTTFLPTGMELVLAADAGTMLADAIQDWHNRHPQYGLAEVASTVAAQVGFIHS